MKTTFKDFDLPSKLLHKLDKINYSVPTPIQAETIPLALQGKDIFGSAQTGTGKTGAFLLPIIANIITNPRSKALILVPTRELAMQVIDFAKKLLSERDKVALLIGGQAIYSQIRQLKSNPCLIIGTPGRMIDHLNRKTLSLKDIKFLVLDEADRMLDMGFQDDIKLIINSLPKDRQTFMFSATIPNDIVNVANQYLKNPERISIGNAQAPALKVKQETIFVEQNDKYKILENELEKRQGSIIIFVKTQIGTEKLAKKLSNKHDVDFIHGNLKQVKRDRIIKSFKTCRFRILVATDVASRGLDIPHIEHVINYDIPQCPEDYIHRIGRTGRGEKEGAALGIISAEDKDKWSSILYFIETGIKKKIKGSSSKPRRKSKPRQKSFSKKMNY